MMVCWNIETVAVGLINVLNSKLSIENITNFIDYYSKFCGLLKNGVYFKFYKQQVTVDFDLFYCSWAFVVHLLLCPAHNDDIYPQ